MYTNMRKFRAIRYYRGTKHEYVEQYPESEVKLCKIAEVQNKP